MLTKVPHFTELSCSQKFIELFFNRSLTFYVAKACSNILSNRREVLYINSINLNVAVNCMYISYVTILFLFINLSLINRRAIGHRQY